MLKRGTTVLSTNRGPCMTFVLSPAGHAVAGWFLQNALPLLKVSIIPRGSAALGPSNRAHISTRILGKTMRVAVRNKESWEQAPYAYPIS